MTVKDDRKSPQSRMRRRAIPTAAAALAAALAGAPGGALAMADPAALCEAATARAAASTGVPAEVLAAIALTESGRSRAGRMRPWPWTLHAEGRGHWFDSAAAAADAAQALLDRGVRNVDVGCFQVNHRWHGAAFASLDVMLDPDTNALHAARFLAGLADELGSWDAAVGAYHSRTPALAERYLARFRTHLAGLSDAPAAAPAPAAPRGTALADAPPLPAPGRPRRGLVAYPLLQAGPAMTPGSLVAAVPGRGSLLPDTARALQ